MLTHHVPCGCSLYVDLFSPFALLDLFWPPLRQVPQMDLRNSCASYLNLKTGEEQVEHPHTRVVDNIRRRERKKATAALDGRLQRLRDYQTQLVAAEQEHRRVFEGRVLELRFRDGPLRKLPTACRGGGGGGKGDRGEGGNDGGEGGGRDGSGVANNVAKT